MIHLKLPGGAQLDKPAGVLAGDVLREAGAVDKAIAAKIDGRVVDLYAPVQHDATLEPVVPGSPEALEVLRHSTAHAMAQAVARYFGEDDLEFAIGPVIDTGFYYDFDLPRALTPDDLPKIEALMKKIRKERLRIERFQADSKDAAVQVLREHKSRSKFKEEVIAGLPDDVVVSFYRQGEFLDMCTGPHLPATSHIGHFKLLSIAGAYWRGDEKREQLQRIYGTAFFDKEELALFLHRREEAEKRDHRKVGVQLDLFRLLPEAPGFPFWMPKGTVLYNTLAAYIREKLDARGYDEIRTPHILLDELWKRSGHYDHYKDNMYFTEIEDRSFAVKPMNCPGAALVYSQGLHSYRDLPLRLAEFGLCHRYEASGALSGMARVRSFVQDDAHIFCSLDQLQDEIQSLIDFRREVAKDLGFRDLLVLSTRPADRTGTEDQWDRAEASLEKAMVDRGAEFSVNEGDGAFYGPKIDFLMIDALERKHQLATIQVDFSLPEKFDLHYIAADGSRQRPVIIHRAILGSFERMIALLIEHFAGAFPLWLAPQQVVILPVADDRHLEACEAANAALRAAGLRSHVDASSNRVGKKIREHTLQKVPYMLVVGDREAESGEVTVRRRDGAECGALSIAECVAKLRAEVDSRALEPSIGPADASDTATT